MARKRRRRRNVRDNHPGLGAFLGSFAGSTVGVLTGYAMGGLTETPSQGWTFPLGLAGSIAGGALGGRMGAANDRKDRSTTGGAIGGIVGPIGAAVGGYVGGLKSDRRSNPSPATVALAVGAGIVAVGAGYGAYRLTKGRKALPGNGQPLPPAQALQGVLANDTLEGQNFMIDDIRQPIQLKADEAPGAEGFSRVPELRVMVDDPEDEMRGVIIEPAAVSFEGNQIRVIDPDGTVSVFNAGNRALDPEADIEPGVPVPSQPEKAIASLISGLSPQSARLAYDLALIHIVSNNVDWSDPAAKDAAIKQILTTVAPKLDWSQGLSNHTVGSPAYQAWTGVELIGTVAEQSYHNKLAEQEA